ncbi:hypothetical protein A9798_03440 [Edwardsiella hoshinae]|uniref:Protein of uncharacterized function (DUF1198) n=1 Tax=Edwardsiella hoshinae TaxID=93378 RepID=A0A376D8V3_9GAMM|nr:DUF1198 family protein [Edwardsiella hoshinae]AOV98504.1 hypothetical protein A9798_03440 [Edwardsiella hoshinae]QPR28012.1 DUF1198 domain-containing protein [Edwardsiella hoshinae]STC85145.1 Protein of uncharacterised function (DUF1198) [Edwardsiella hoshinae]
MIWLMLATLALVFIAGFRVLNTPTRRACQRLTQRLNIEPVHVESLISQMGTQQGQAFVRYLLSGGESHLNNGAMVLLIYQTFIVNESDDNLHYWRSLIRKAGLNADISPQQVRLALDFLRELAPDAAEMLAFRLRYQQLFAQPSEDAAGEGDNIYILDDFR